VSRAAAVNFVDYLAAAGQYRARPIALFVPGGEFAGVINALGRALSDLRSAIRSAPRGFNLLPQSIDIWRTRR